MQKEEVWKYAEEMLDKVSRTFALNIKVLGKKLKNPVLLAYLYMRIADTIEDDQDLSVKEKIHLLEKFSMSLNLEEKSIEEFVKALPKNWQTNEKADYILCCNAQIVIPLLLEYNEQTRNIIKKSVREMCSGMAMFIERIEKRIDGWFFIENENDLDEYCYFVAGLVGNMLTELFCANCKINKKQQQKLEELSVSFGIALQIVNIIKDIKEDSLRKVCFIPLEFCRKHNINSVQELFSEETNKQNKNLVIGELINKAKRHLQDAKNYIKVLPVFEYRVRLFCLWPSLMALDNLLIIGDGSIIFKPEKAKISRETVAKIIRYSTIFGWNNLWIEKMFSKLQK